MYKLKRKKIPVTVCIAAIYDYDPYDRINHPGAIIGVSDRMITAFGGLIESQPESQKNKPITKFIAIMTAGDADLQTELYYKVGSIVNRRTQGLKTLLPVYEVAKYYAQTYRQIEKELAEKETLFPLGLNYQSFIKRQKEMSPEFITDITTRISNYKLNSNGQSKDAETIITGIDETGPHIFVVNNKDIMWCDSIGYAAVGSGKYHADFHLELAGQTPRTIEAQTLINIHRAKKKAEITQGVGDQTDMFVLSHQYGYTPLKPINDKNIVSYLDDQYKEYLSQVEELDKKQLPVIQEYILKLNETETEPKTQEQAVESVAITVPEPKSPKKKTVKKR